MNALRRTLGLLPLQRLGDMFLQADLILATTVEPLEYPRSDWPSNLRFVGPLIWEPPSQQSWSPPISKDPLILVAGSSIPERPAAAFWAHRVIDALREAPLHVVATLPTGPLPTASATVMVERMLPHGQILQHAACVVCHGGPGITQKALALGVPVVSVPFAFDRYEVARRTEMSQAGVTLRLDSLSPTHVRNAVQRAIAMRSGAARIARMFAAAGGAVAAATYVEAVGADGNARDDAFILRSLHAVDQAGRLATANSTDS